jgi:hypothetical protein
MFVFTDRNEPYQFTDKLWNRLDSQRISIMITGPARKISFMTQQYLVYAGNAEVIRGIFIDNNRSFSYLLLNTMITN